MDMLRHANLYFYRPQTKFAKVIFLHVSVILSMGGTWAGTPPAGTPPGRYTPQDMYNTPAGTPPGQVHPQPQRMLGYAQQVGGTHPTGMYSCYHVSFDQN